MEYGIWNINFIHHLRAASRWWNRFANVHIICHGLERISRTVFLEPEPLGYLGLVCRPSRRAECSTVDTMDNVIPCFSSRRGLFCEDFQRDGILEAQL